MQCGHSIGLSACNARDRSAEIYQRAPEELISVLKAIRVGVSLLRRRCSLPAWSGQCAVVPAASGGAGPEFQALNFRYNHPLSKGLRRSLMSGDICSFSVERTYRWDTTVRTNLEALLQLVRQR